MDPKLTTHVLIPGTKAQFVHSDSMTIAEWEFEAGSTIAIPRNAVHSGKAISACHMIDVFNPVREDFQNYQ